MNYSPGDLIKVAGERNSIVEVEEVREWGIRGWELEGPKARRTKRQFRSIEWGRIERRIEG